MKAPVSTILSRCKQALVDTFRRYQRLHWAGKAFIWFLILFHIALITLFVVVHPDRIFQFLFDLAKKLRENRFGWLILGAWIVVTCMPPLFGFSMSMTVVGFAYGVPGWFLAAPLAVIGSGLAFLVLRLLFRNHVKRWTAASEKWQALEAVIRAHGLPLIILVRLCPLPWVYSNAFFASIEAVSFWQFVFATLFMTPRLLLQVFIGSRIALFSDGTHRGEMDLASKILNAVSIVVGIALGVGTGVFIYRLTQRKIRELEDMPSGVDELAAEALEDAERRALLGSYPSSDDIEADASLDRGRRMSRSPPVLANGKNPR